MSIDRGGGGDSGEGFMVLSANILRKGSARDVGVNAVAE